MNKFKEYQNSGFTLVETLVAITILMIGVIGPLNTAVRGISDGLFAANQIAANYLAQEAMESIIWKRNSNINPLVENSEWYQGLADRSCGSPGNNAVSCVVDSLDPSVIVQDGADCSEVIIDRDHLTSCDLVFSDTQRRYMSPSDPSVGDTIGTIFRRRVFLVPSGPVPPNEIKVVVKVAWSNRGNAKSMTLVERLYPKI